jgi:hypothetical protein
MNKGLRMNKGWRKEGIVRLPSSLPFSIPCSFPVEPQTRIITDPNPTNCGYPYRTNDGA